MNIAERSGRNDFPNCASILEGGMIPYLHLWTLNIPTFGLMLWVAAVAAAFILDRSFRRAGIDGDAVGMVAVAVVAGIVGAKLWHVLDSADEFREIGWRVLWDTAGFAWFGGTYLWPRSLSATGLAGWNRRVENSRSGIPCRSCWLWNWANRLLPVGRWMLWNSNKFAVGHELPEWAGTDAGEGASDTPI